MMLHYLRCCCVVSSPGRNIKTQKKNKKKTSKERRHGRADFVKWDAFFFPTHEVCFVRRCTKLFTLYACRKKLTEERKVLDISSENCQADVLFFHFGGFYLKFGHAAYSCRRPSWEEKSLPASCQLYAGLASGC